MIPLSIIRAKNIKLDGMRPTHLIGYGAYGISYDADFDPVWLAWLERGDVIAIAHVRGGGEYGEQWYRAGYKLTKQHTIDDFIACAQYLIENNYTSPRYLSGEGTSAGGILIGGAITQRPDLFAGALIRAGCSNALRKEFAPNGPPNIAEFGTVTDPDGFKALYAMDAYQHVKDGIAYPGILLTAGVNDPQGRSLTTCENGGSLAGSHVEQEACPVAGGLRCRARHRLYPGTTRLGIRRRNVISFMAGGRPRISTLMVEQHGPWNA